MGTMEEVSGVIKLWLSKFISNQLLYFLNGLQYDSFSMFVCVFNYMGESLVRNVHSIYERFKK